MCARNLNITTCDQKFLWNKKEEEEEVNHLTTTLYFTMHVKFYLFFIVDVFVSYNLFLSLYVLALLMSCE